MLLWIQSALMIVQLKQLLYLEGSPYRMMHMLYKVKRLARKRRVELNESRESKMQRAVCPLVTLFHQERQLTRACWWKTWHWAIITTAACGAAFGREKRLHLLLKCFTFCWDRVTLSATCLLRKLQSKAKLMSHNVQGEQQAFWVMSAPKQQGHANSERQNRDGVKAWQTRHVRDSERCDNWSFYTVWSDGHNEALHPPWVKSCFCLFCVSITCISARWVYKLESLN